MSPTRRGSSAIDQTTRAMRAHCGNGGRSNGTVTEEAPRSIPRAPLSTGSWANEAAFILFCLGVSASQLSLSQCHSALCRHC